MSNTEINTIRNDQKATREVLNVTAEKKNSHKFAHWDKKTGFVGEP